MATGERIRRFRKRLGMTQRHLGQLLGFPANSADVRMAQYVLRRVDDPRLET